MCYVQKYLQKLLVPIAFVIFENMVFLSHCSDHMQKKKKKKRPFPKTSWVLSIPHFFFSKRHENK